MQPADLEAASDYKWAQTEACMKELQRIYTRSPMNVLKVIRQRYMKEARERVAQRSPPLHYDMSW